MCVWLMQCQVSENISVSVQLISDVWKLDVWNDGFHSHGHHSHTEGADRSCVCVYVCMCVCVSVCLCVCVCVCLKLPSYFTKKINSLFSFLFLFTLLLSSPLPSAGLGDPLLDVDSPLCHLGLHRFLFHLLLVLWGHHLVWPAPLLTLYIYIL